MPSLARSYRSNAASSFWNSSTRRAWCTSHATTYVLSLFSIMIQKLIILSQLPVAAASPSHLRSLQHLALETFLLRRRFLACHPRLVDKVSPRLPVAYLQISQCLLRVPQDSHHSHLQVASPGLLQARAPAPQQAWLGLQERGLVAHHRRHHLGMHPLVPLWGHLLVLEMVASLGFCALISSFMFPSHIPASLFFLCDCC